MSTSPRKAAADKTRIASRRQLVATYFLHGTSSQAEIRRLLAEKHQIDVDASLISKDMAALREEWRQSATRDMEAAIDEELAKIEAIAQAAWSGWTTSRDVAFLNTLAKLSERRSKIRGIDSPTKVALTGPDGQSPPRIDVAHLVAVMSDAEKRAFTESYARAGQLQAAGALTVEHKPAAEESPEPEYDDMEADHDTREYAAAGDTGSPETLDIAGSAVAGEEEGEGRGEGTGEGGPSGGAGHARDEHSAENVEPGDLW